MVVKFTAKIIDFYNGYLRRDCSSLIKNKLARKCLENVLHYCLSFGQSSMAGRFLDGPTPIGQHQIPRVVLECAPRLKKRRGCPKTSSRRSVMTGINLSCSERD